MQETSNKMQDSMDRTAQTMGDTIVQVLDRLAGKKTDLKLIFQDLSFDAGTVFKAKMSGAVVLEATMAKDIESEELSSKATTSATVYSTS